MAYAANHDLRAPVVTISQLVESILEDYAAELPEEVARRLVLVRDRADRLDILLRRLTRLWRAADASEEPRPVALHELTSHLARDLEAPPGAVHTAAPASIEVPRRAFTQLISELVDNAIRHAGRHDLRVEVKAERRTGGWDVSVSDNGGGIPARYRERVLRPFYTLAARPDCVGLGLAIARRIVETHGGRMWIDEAPGGGARVGFFWPAASRT